MKRSLFFSSFIKFILEFNGISSIDEELVKAPKLVDSTAINLMHYYKDKNNRFYYLDTDGSLVYEDWIIEPKKKKESSSTGEAGSTSAGLLSVDPKIYFDDWFGKILADNQAREDRVMSHIKSVAKQGE